MDNLHDFFDRIFVISLKRTPERLAAFRRRIDECGWPFRDIEEIEAIDGRLCPFPPWWVVGKGAWGAYRSHVQVIERGLNQGAKRILVMEDDASPCTDFPAKAETFLRSLPSNWELAYLGGQTTHFPQKLERINEHVAMPESCNRMHAYALSHSGMEKAYRQLCRMNWYRGEKLPDGKWKQGHHCDHHLEQASRARQIITYCPASVMERPPRWLMDQAAGYSEILNRHVSERSFTGWPKQSTMVAVLGPYRGGTSATAGAMHYLGIPMGRRFVQYKRSTNEKGCFEAVMLHRICQTAYPEPKFEEKCSREDRVKLLKLWADGRAKSGKEGPVIGGKDPLLCLMVPEMTEAWPNCKFVVVHRDIEHSIRSLRRHGWFRPHTKPEDITRRLVETRDAALKDVPADRQLHINYEDLCTNPMACLKIIAAFTGISPKQEHFEHAMQFIDGGLNHHGGKPSQQPTQEQTPKCGEEGHVCTCGTR